MNDLSGQQFGNYRLTRLLGQGGFADTYLGEQIYIHTYAAVKVVQTQLGQGDQESFFNEARMVAHLNHPNIVRLIDFGVSSNRNMPYLIMDYAPNGTLRQRHPRGEVVPVARVAQYVRNIAAALQYAHDQKVIHRDVKPENMLIAANQEILLSDFGIAVVLNSLVQSPSSVAGTMSYMAPEQIQGHPTAASDQYALAVAAYEWLCGVSPFSGSYAEIAAQHTHTAPLPLRQRVGTIPPEIEQIVLTALAKDPQQRFRSVQAFANAFEQASKAASGPLQPLMESQSNIPTMRGSYAGPYSESANIPPTPQTQTAYGQNLDMQGPPPPPAFMPLSGSYNPQTPSPPAPNPPSGTGFTPRITPQMTPSSISPQYTPAQYTPSNYPFVSQDASSGYVQQNTGQQPGAPPPTTTKNRRPSTLLLIALVAAIILIIGSVVFVYAAVYQPFLHGVQATATVGAQNSATVLARANATGTVVTQATATQTTLQNIYAQSTSGTLVLNDALTSPDNYGWSHYSDASGMCDYVGTTYHSRAQVGYFAPCYASATNFSDFAFQVQMKIISGAVAGVVYRAPHVITDHSAYHFLIGTDGSYQIYSVTVDKQGNHFPPLRSGFSAAIHTGLNQENLLTVVARGNTFYFYANKQYLNQVTDDTYKSGSIGVVTNSSSASGTEAIFTTAQVWQLG